MPAGVISVGTASRMELVVAVLLSISMSFYEGISSVGEEELVIDTSSDGGTAANISSI